MAGAARRTIAAAATTLAAALLATACMIESPTIEATSEPAAPTAIPTVAAPVFEPTSVVEPTATPAPIPTVAPTAEPTAVPTPAPDITVIEARTPGETVEPVIVEPGLVEVPVGGATTFRLARPRPILQQPGHSLIYVDPDREAEVDIFTPIANGEGDPLADLDAVVAEITSNAVFADLDELAPVTIAGNPARVFEGALLTGERGFHTDLLTIGNDWAGWFPPARARLWLIDTPGGPLIVTAESLFDPGQYDEAVRMAGGLLSTMRFGPPR